MSGAPDALVFHTAHDAEVQVDLVRIRTGMQRPLDAVEARRDDVGPVPVTEELEAAQVRERGRVTLREESSSVAGASVISHNLTIIDVLRTGPDLDRTTVTREFDYFQ